MLQRQVHGEPIQRFLLQGLEGGGGARLGLGLGLGLGGYR